ncbi:hypothetical protein [Desulfovibrio sp.]|uniref:hypothetical protein n=1 Tax=Desulfovibrio sp. TaxID=885 RepID=UPI0023C9811C|nr:hypothetical protein [Desulfovibrio sp.]MDE7242199.1 hypothetical protein [Desulfovibrio sp.]
MRERAPLRSAPLAARRFCLDCQGASPGAVRSCADGDCPLWRWRLPHLPPAGGNARAAGAALSRAVLRAIRRQCLACAGSRWDVRACAAREDCALWSYRFGVRPRTYREVRRRFFAPRELDLPLAPASARPGGA